MINGKIEQFIDTGWYSEATLYYQGHIYWCEAQSSTDGEKTIFFVDKWPAENESNLYYHSLLEANGTIRWKRIFEIEGTDLDKIKRLFLEAHIFEGKTFWQVEKDIAWLEEAESIVKP